MADKLDGAVAIVTGGSQGYGAGIAEALKQAGAQVWITARGEDVLDAMADRLGVHAVRADVTVPEDWDRLFAEVLAKTGKLDILVNNAGAGIHISPMTEQTDTDIATSIAVNLTGALFGCRRAARVMQKQNRGTIVNISSVCALHAWPGFGPYSAAKAGLNMFSHCLYTELREAGVRVTTLTPSWGATNFAASAGLPRGPNDTPAMQARKMQPLELGQLVVQVCTLPEHLVIPDMTVQPLIQRIEPM